MNPAPVARMPTNSRLSAANFTFRSSMDLKTSWARPVTETEAAPAAPVTATFTFTLHKGKLTRFQGFDDFMKRLSDEDAEVGKMIKMFLTEDVLKTGPTTLGILIDSYEGWEHLPNQLPVSPNQPS